MKRTSALYAATVIIALSFAGQALAKGGSGGNQGHGSAGGTHQLASTMSSPSGNGMQQRVMMSDDSHQDSALGSGPQNMKQGGSKNRASHKGGQKHS